MDLAAGSTAFSKFEVLEKIGAGGMGSIYKVRDVTLDRVVVLKVLTSQLDHAGSLVRFQNEAKALGRLKHSSIAGVYDFGISKSGEAYLAMDFIDGETLREFVDFGHAMLLSEKLKIFIQLCEAVRHAHSEGVIHRDIKPENIMLVRTDKHSTKPVLLDFGIAKLGQDGSQTGQQLTGKGRIIGSPLFMSPEQAAGEAVTPASDQYSLGCVLFYMLTGKPPLQGASAIETMAMHINTVPTSLQNSSGITYPQELEDLVARLLSKRPDARFQSLDEVIEVLVPLKENALLEEAGDSVEEEPPVVANSFKSLGAAKTAALSILIIACFTVPAVFKSVSVEDAQTTGKVKSTFEQFNVGESIKNSLARDPNNLRLAENVSNEDLKVLKGCKTLTFVELSCNRVDDAGVSYLADSKLRRLILSISSVSTLEPVGRMSDLEALELMNTPITDESLKQLSKLKNLAELRLDETSITDAGLKHLENLGTLERLSLDGTQVTMAGVEALSKRLPMCEISFGGKTLGRHDEKDAVAIKVEKQPGEALLLIEDLIRATEKGFGSRQTPMISQLLYMKWHAAFVLGNNDLAFKSAQEAYDIARDTRNRRYRALTAMAFAAANRLAKKTDKALALQEEAIQLAIDYSGPNNDTTIQSVSAFLSDANVNKDIKRRERLTSSYLALMSGRADASPWKHSMALSWQAETEFMKGNYDRSIALAQQSIQVAKAEPDKVKRQSSIDRNQKFLELLRTSRAKSG